MRRRGDAYNESHLSIPYNEISQTGKFLIILNSTQNNIIP